MSFLERPESSFNSLVIRENKEELDARIEALQELYVKHKRNNVTAMFSISYMGFDKSPVFNFDMLTEDEVRDIDNFVMYAIPRIVTGVAYSPAFHKKIVLENDGLDSAFKTFLESVDPEEGIIGHDSIHAMFAYIKSGAQSLIPAYAKTEKLFGDMGGSPEEAANLEEAYVQFFADIPTYRGWVEEILSEKDISIDQATEAFLKKFESYFSKLFTETGTFLTEEYMSQNRLPEIREIIKNYISQIKSETLDPNFAFHEFQRILRPLLTRLRNKENG